MLLGFGERLLARYLLLRRSGFTGQAAACTREEEIFLPHIDLLRG